jgi:hypothetical protein
MATLKQFEANRRNAQKSTGPQTPEGKAAVSMNALRHGLRARTVVLPGKNREEFTQLATISKSNGIPNPGPSSSMSNKWLSRSGN